MALGLTQPLTEISNMNIPWGVKAAGAYDWQPYHLHGPTVLKSGSLCILEHSEPVQVCTGIVFFTFFDQYQGLTRDRSQRVVPYNK